MKSPLSSKCCCFTNERCDVYDWKYVFYYQVAQSMSYIVHKSIIHVDALIRFSRSSIFIIKQRNISFYVRNEFAGFRIFTRKRTS